MNSLIFDRIKNCFEDRIITLQLLKTNTSTRLISAYKILLNQDKSQYSKSWWTQEIMKDLYNINDKLKVRISFDDVRAYIIHVKSIKN